MIAFHLVQLNADVKDLLLPMKQLHQEFRRKDQFLQKI